jgi:nitric oxide reductase
MDIELPQFPFPREHGCDPPSLNAQLRHKAPISKVRLYDGTPAWIVTKHRQCCEALESDKLSADRRVPGYPEIHAGGHKAKEGNPTFVNMDNPGHDEQRAMLQPEFTPQTVQERWRPMMEQTIDTLLDAFIEKGQAQQPIDLIRHFATPIPIQTIYKALGVPEKDAKHLSKDSEVRNSTSRNAAETANKELQEYVRNLVKDKIKEPGDDIISKLVVEQYKMGHLSEEDVTTLAFLVLTAGNAALINSIGLGTLTLLEHPDQLSEFRKSPQLAPKVVYEVCRYHTASALNCRRAVKTDMKLGGQDFKKGEGVICAVQAANRDEDVFDHAEEFDIRRETGRVDSLAFGYGMHRCLGESFSRTQLEIVFTKLFERLPNLRLAKKPSELPYTRPTMNIGVTELPVYFE